MRKRREVFRNKKNLKGKKNTITESLTMRISLLSERAKEKSDSFHLLLVDADMHLRENLWISCRIYIIGLY